MESVRKFLRFDMLLTVAIIFLAAYLLPRYIDYRITKFAAENGIKLKQSRSEEQVASAENFAASNPRLMMDGLPSIQYDQKSLDNTIVIFTDYTCAYCKKMEKYLEGNNPKGINIVYKELPVLGQESKELSILGYAANKQGKYEEYRSHILPIGHPTKTDGEAFLRSNNIAAPSAIEVVEFQKSIDSNLSLAKQLHIEGTPAIYLGGKIIYGWNEKAFREALTKIQNGART